MRLYSLILLSVLIACSSNKILDSDVQENQFLQIDETKLAVPYLKLDSIFFKSSAKLEADFNLEDSDILYKTETTTYNKFLTPLEIKESSSFKFKSVKNNYQDSNEIKIQAIKVNNLIRDAEISISPMPKDPYQGDGLQTLTDLKKGSSNFRDGNKWLGFQSKEVVIDINFKEKTTIQNIYLSSLNDVNSWIFNPESVVVVANDQMHHNHDCKLSKETDPAQLNIIKLSFNPIATKSLSIQLNNLEAIPDWHPGKGTSPWFFIDEIIVE